MHFARNLSRALALIAWRTCTCNMQHATCNMHMHMHDQFDMKLERTKPVTMRAHLIVQNV